MHAASSDDHLLRMAEVMHGDRHARLFDKGGRDYGDQPSEEISRWAIADMLLLRLSWLVSLVAGE